MSNGVILKAPEAESPAGADETSVNVVRLVGRVCRVAEARSLPSGDEVWTLWVSVPDDRLRDGRRRVDVIACTAWAGRAIRSLASWRLGDLVEVEGSLRHRFFKTGGGTASRTEVEVRSARLRSRAK